MPEFILMNLAISGLIVLLLISATVNAIMAFLYFNSTGKRILAKQSSETLRWFIKVCEKELKKRGD